MHKIASILAVSALALALGACGGSNDKAFVGSGGSSGSSSSSSSATAVANITLITSVPQIPSDNSKPATITAIVTNSANAVVPGVGVVFSASSGAIAATTTSTGTNAGTSDANGEAAATLSTPGDPSDRTITVTATVGTVSATINVAVIGTTLTVTGPTSLIQGGTPGNFSVALTNSSGAGISAQAVSISSAKGNTLSAASLTTDPSGHATFTMTGTTAGTDTVSAGALALKASQTVVVSGANFNITTPTANANIDINTPQTVTVVWLNSGTPQAGQTVTFNATRGTFTGGVVSTTATTDATGTATATLTSATAGPVVITASATGVSTQATAEFIATTPATIDVQASPASIATSAQSTITAIVWDANNNLVAGQTVDFQLTDTTGGSISVASAVTDDQGRAQTVYTAGTVPSSQNGVIVTATVQGSTVAPATAKLTVGGQTLFLSMGTTNIVLLLPTGCGSSAGQTACTQFGDPFIVQALDSSGNAVPGVTITLTVHSFPYADVPASVISAPPNGPGSGPVVYAAYAKGYYAATGNAACTSGLFAGSAWCQVITATCVNEDVDGSGILKSASEDINGNGRLDPGDVAAASPGSVTTDSTGSASFTVVYPQDHAAWIHVVLTATATVSGNQTSTASNFWLPIAGTDLSSTTASPPGQPSPYGQGAVCTDPN